MKHSTSPPGISPVSTLIGRMNSLRNLASGAGSISGPPTGAFSLGHSAAKNNDMIPAIGAFLFA